ncbi:unnamed protein product [Mytilus coruscus]|uniref:Uncharacterized protein n=1 Tax=Mytilus coruscus TaxID=42192 RepID=A0A6J8CB49_MYTCO|nr:unnamed protein product [Mytilus coruscus]
MVHKSSALNNLCLYCDHVALPQDCTHVVRCPNHKQCSGVAIGKRKTPKTDKRMHVERGNFAHHNERDLGDTSLCHACCNGQDLCNIYSLCGAPGMCNSTNHKPVIQKNVISDRLWKQRSCNVKLNASLGVPYADSNGNIKFNCSILSSTLRTDVQYNVTWTIDGFPLKSKNGISLGSILSSYERVAILNTIHLQGNLNKMLRCKVEVTCSNDSKVETAMVTG